MAKEGNDGQEKTEQPTSKRIQKSRQEGQVAKSQEMNFVAGLMGALIYFALYGSSMVKSIQILVKRIMSTMVGIEITPLTVEHIARDVVGDMLAIIMPFMLVLVVVAVLSNIFQIGFLFTTKPMVPKFDKLNVVKGLKKLFALSKLVELLKSVLKLIVIAIVPYFVIMAEIDRLPLIMDMTTWSIMTYIGQVMLKILFYSSIVLLLLAILDFVYQKWKHNRDLMMSKQEVKDELKQSEGDPKIKARIRRLQFEYLRKAMMDQVPKADVVVTNPVTYAVALKYDREEMDAPTVVAKGARKLAEKIKQIARENNIPIVEDKPLARSLYKMVEVGDIIPENLYKAVAEILAYVYSRKNRVSSAAV